MDRKTDLEAWADSVLDAHRTGPRTPRPDEPVRDEELPPMLRLMRKHGHFDIDRERFEKLKRHQERGRSFEAIEGVLTIVGGGLMLAFVWAAYSAF